jgi:glutathione S-transferase
MKLYNELNPAPNPRRVRIFLAEKGLSIPFVHVPLRQGAHKEPGFLSKNSLGQVPVLELDDGSTLSESVAICRYLEELHPQPALFGATPWQRAQVEMWMRRIEFGLMSRIGAVWVHTHKFTAHLGTQYKDRILVNSHVAHDFTRQGISSTRFVDAGQRSRLADDSSNIEQAQHA